MAEHWNEGMALTRVWLLHDFKVRVGAMIADLYNAVAENGGKQGDIDDMHCHLKADMMLLAATMHIDRQHAPDIDKSDEGFVEIARGCVTLARKLESTEQ